MKSYTNYKDKGRSNSSLLLFGDGDGGGGPQVKHIERLIRLQDFEGAPKVKFSTCLDFFSQLEGNSKDLMKWEGELYLELHNGTYTTMAENKKYNRTQEILFRDVEILASIAQIVADEEEEKKDREGFVYQNEHIRELWRTFLIDQFHDVLPGTCIGLVYEDTRANAIHLREESQKIIESAIRSISKTLLGSNITKVLSIRPQIDDIILDSKSQYLLSFNTLNFDRFDTFRVKVND